MDLSAPHHDGSERHVSTQEPTLGEQVTVWLRVPHDDPADHVWVRTTPDAEPHFTAATIDRSTAHETWWRADIEAHNPVTNYRFLLDGGSGYRFVNGTGVHHSTVNDAADFRLSTHAPPPAWLREIAGFYQIFPDRFARSGEERDWPAWAAVSSWGDAVDANGKTAVRQVFGGDLAGIEAHLDHVTSLGLGALYLTPFFPAPSSHRYDADTFDRVDPLLGGDAALVALTRAAHQRGLRMIGDLTINHTGRGHEWFRAAQTDASADEAAFFFFRNHPRDYESWFDVPTLPKFDLRDAELRRRLLDGSSSVAAKWLQPPFDLDGWRIDVANMAGRHGGIDVNHEAAVALRATLATARADAYLIAEHCYDASRDLDGDGWHGVMNYLTFTRPVWSWLRHDGITDHLFGDPSPLPSWGGATTVRSMLDVAATQPWRSTVSGFNLLGSHDTSRFREIAGSAAAQRAGAALLFTWPGTPMVFAGDELGLRGHGLDGARRTMPWAADGSVDGDVLDDYRQLAALRRSSRALRHGGLRVAHAGHDAIVFVRESLDERLLVHVARRPHAPVAICAAALDGRPGAVRYGNDTAPERRDDHVLLPGDGPGATVWELT